MRLLIRSTAVPFCTISPPPPRQQHSALSPSLGHGGLNQAYNCCSVQVCPVAGCCRSHDPPPLGLLMARALLQALVEVA